MNASKIIKNSSTGHSMLMCLRSCSRSFATADLLTAIATSPMSARGGRNVSCVPSAVACHGNHLINGAPQTVTGEETVWQLAEEIGDELDAYTANLSHITELVDQLGQLRPNQGAMPDPRS